MDDRNHRKGWRATRICDRMNVERLHDRASRRSGTAGCHGSLRHEMSARSDDRRRDRNRSRSRERDESFREPSLRRDTSPLSRDQLGCPDFVYGHGCRQDLFPNGDGETRRAGQLDTHCLNNSRSRRQHHTQKRHSPDFDKFDMLPAEATQCVSDEFFNLGADSVSKGRQTGVAREKAQETDEHRIRARQKQIEFGYNTLGYARYIKLVPKDRRSFDKQRHPRTPDPYQVCSKRSYDGQIRKWRRLLHAYDPPEELGQEIVSTHVGRGKTQKDKRCDLSVDKSGAASKVTVETTPCQSDKSLEDMKLLGQRAKAAGMETTDADVIFEGGVVKKPQDTRDAIDLQHRSIYDEWEGSDEEFGGIV